MNKIKIAMQKIAGYKATCILLNMGFVAVIISMCMLSTGEESSRAVIFASLLIMFQLIFLIMWRVLCRQLAEKEETVKQQRVMQEQQTMMLHVRNEETEETWEELKKFRHDYTNHLICIREYMKKKNEDEALKYVESLLGSSKGDSGTGKMSNSFVDTFLNHKIKKAKQEDINLKINITIPKELPFEEMDICIILGNAFDNAVEAVRQLPGEERFINISMKYIRHTLKMEMENSFNGEVKKDRKGRLLTTKTDSMKYGMGISLMESAISKYDGLLDITSTKNIFRLKVLLYEKEKF